MTEFIKHSHKYKSVRIRYVEVWSPNHPNKMSNNCVLEHRLVMEKHLGRYLTKEEVVHHKNKIITDNRIENLELYSNHSKHMKKDMNKRFCLECKSNKTYTKKGKYQHWYNYKDGWLCHACYMHFKKYFWKLM